MWDLSFGSSVAFSLPLCDFGVMVANSSASRCALCVTLRERVAVRMLCSSDERMRWKPLWCGSGEDGLEASVRAEPAVEVDDSPLREDARKGLTTESVVGSTAAAMVIC